MTIDDPSALGAALIYQGFIHRLRHRCMPTDTSMSHRSEQTHVMHNSGLLGLLIGIFYLLADNVEDALHPEATTEQECVSFVLCIISHLFLSLDV